MEPQTVKPESEAYSQGFSQHVDRQPNLPGVCSLLNADNRGTHFGGSMSIRKTTLTVLSGLIGILLQSAQGPRQTPFYLNKTIQVVIGSAPGGLYYRWGRLFAQHLGKYIPGNPNLVAQNIPGGGSMIATNYLYGLAKPDGLTIGMFQTFIYLQQLVGVLEVKYDVRKFNWLELAGKRPDDALYTRRFTVQVDGRYPESQRTTEVRWFQRHRPNRPIDKTLGRDHRRKVH